MTDWTDARQRVERLIRDANGSPDADGRGWTAGVGDADAAALRALLAQVDQVTRERDAAQIDAMGWETRACRACACVWDDDAVTPKKECVYHGALRKAAIKAEADAAALVSRLGEAPVSREDREQALGT
jgi:hypothetical protein